MWVAIQDEEGRLIIRDKRECIVHTDVCKREGRTELVAYITHRDGTAERIQARSIRELRTLADMLALQKEMSCAPSQS